MPATRHRKCQPHRQLMASEWCHNVFTVMAPTAFSLFAHITGIVFTSEVNLLRLTCGNIYSIFRSDSEMNFTNMLYSAAHFQHQPTADLWAPGGVSPGLILEEAMTWSLCSPCLFSGSLSVWLVSPSCVSPSPLQRRKILGDLVAFFRHLKGFPVEVILFYVAPKDWLADYYSLIHSFIHNSIKPH